MANPFRKMRALTDAVLHQILGEFHQVLNQHAQVVNHQRAKIQELNNRVNLLEVAAGINIVEIPEVQEGEVVDETAPVTEALIDRLDASTPMLPEDVEFADQLAAQEKPAA